MQRKCHSYFENEVIMFKVLRLQEFDSFDSADIIAVGQRRQLSCLNINITWLLNFHNVGMSILQLCEETTKTQLWVHKTRIKV